MPESHLGVPTVPSITPLILCLPRIRRKTTISAHLADTLMMANLFVHRICTRSFIKVNKPEGLSDLFDTNVFRKTNTICDINTVVFLFMLMFG